MAKTNHKFPDHANRNYYERDTEFEVLLNSLYYTRKRIPLCTEMTATFDPSEKGVWSRMHKLFPGLDLDSGLDWTLDWTHGLWLNSALEHLLKPD